MTATAGSARTTSRRRFDRPLAGSSDSATRPLLVVPVTRGIVPRAVGPRATISAACRQTGPGGRLARWWAGSGRTLPSSRRSASWCSPCSRRASTSTGSVTACPRGPCWPWSCWSPPFLSIPLSRDGRGPSVHVDTPFVFALALAAGTGAAAVVMAASGVLYDLAHRKPFHKVAFNNGTHTIGLAAGALVWTTLAGGQVTGSEALPAILTGTAVFVAVKFGLFAGALTLDASVRSVVSPPRFLRHLLLIVVMAQVGVLVLVLAAERPALLLLALGPMLAAYLLLRGESRAVLARDDA